MAYTGTTMLAATLLLAAAPAAAQQLENKRTPETSGTVRAGDHGRLSGANLSPGSGPAAETHMPAQQPKTEGRSKGGAQAGADDATKELFQH